MLGLSKLLLLLLVIAVVWFGFRYASRVDAVRRALREELARRQPPQKAQRVEAEDLVKCGRADCPWGRAR
jgi:uncharacterized iron-regulated membrane protein